MKTMLKTLALLILIMLGSLSLLIANNFPIRGGLCFVLILIIGYFMNKKGWLLNPNDL